MRRNERWFAGGRICALILPLFCIGMLASCGKGVPDEVSDLPVLAPFMSEEQKENLREEQELLAAAEPLTLEAVREAMREDVAGGLTEAKHVFLTGSASWTAGEENTTGFSPEALPEMVRYLMDHDYRIGYFTENIEYTTSSRKNILTVEMNYTAKSRGVSYEDCLPGGTCYEGAYSKEDLRDLLLDAVLAKKTHLVAVYETSEYQQVMKDVEEVENSDEYILYYLDSANGVATLFGDTMILEQDFVLNENASENIIEMDGRSDLAVIMEMIGRQDDWKDELVFHYPAQRDWHEIVQLAEIAAANDTREMAATMDVFQTREYTGGEGSITIMEFLFAEGLDDRASYQAALAEALRAAEEELGIAGSGEKEGGETVFFSSEADEAEEHTENGENTAENDGPDMLTSDEEVRRIFQEMDDAYSAEEAEELYRKITDYVTSSAGYDNDLADAIKAEADYTPEQYYNMSAYGALVSGRTVCSGYAAAVKALCDAAGLPCWVINGSAWDEKAGQMNGHSWNAVLIDGETYYIDPTYIDSGWEEECFLFRDESYDGRVRDEGWKLPW